MISYSYTRLHSTASRLLANNKSVLIKNEFFLTIQNVKQEVYLLITLSASGNWRFETHALHHSFYWGDYRLLLLVEQNFIAKISFAISR